MRNLMIGQHSQPAHQNTKTQHSFFSHSLIYKENGHASSWVTDVTEQYYKGVMLL